MSALFIGTYLSHKKGGKSVAEKVRDLLGSSYPIKLCSHRQNKFMRLADIFFATLFFGGAQVIIDVFSGQNFIITTLTTFITKKIRRKKLVLILRGGMFAEFHQKNTAKIDKVLKQADTIATPSLFLKEYFEKSGYTVEYLPNFIQLDKFNYTGVQRKPQSLLWVRSFRYIYNPELAINTLNILLKKYPDATLTMVGPDGGLLEECKKIAIELGISEKVDIPGPVANNQLADFYSSHSVYLNTTSYESFGMALMEAAACEIPIVSTAVGEIPVLWNEGEDILLINDFDAQNMAVKVSSLFDDNAKAAQMASKARKKVVAYSWPSIKPKWEKLFQSV